MKNWDTQLSTILKDSLSPMKFTFFHSEDATNDYQKIYSNMDNYQDKDLWDLYSIPSLVRVLTLKNQILSEECLEEFYKDSAEEVCFVLEWTPKTRKIIVFNTEQASVFDQETFIESINVEQENLKKLFNRALFS
ncbi:MAG: hypothetical protein ACJAT2_001784 [Bacteriovoracaceae bacterium]|jgi:hypothetical protein